jgi:hypothetical protein
MRRGPMQSLEVSFATCVAQVGTKHLLVRSRLMRTAWQLCTPCQLGLPSSASAGDTSSGKAHTCSSQHNKSGDTAADGRCWARYSPTGPSPNKLNVVLLICLCANPSLIHRTSGGSSGASMHMLSVSVCRNHLADRERSHESTHHCV